MPSIVHEVPTKEISKLVLSNVQVDHLIDSIFDYSAICRMQSFVLCFLECTLNFQTASAGVS